MKIIFLNLVLIILFYLIHIIYLSWRLNWETYRANQYQGAFEGCQQSLRYYGL